MKNLIGLVLLVTLAVPALAVESLRCDSPDVVVTGTIQRTYVRMGAYNVTGYLQVLGYDHRRIVSSSSFEVRDGRMQDDRTLFVASAQDQDGRQVSLDIRSNSPQPSFVRIGAEGARFFPVCVITPVVGAPAACASSPSLGLYCHTTPDGRCACQQHNEH